MAQICIVVLGDVCTQVGTFSDFPLPWALANTFEKAIVRLWSGSCFVYFILDPFARTRKRKILNSMATSIPRI
jgi:hypothetical protein